MGAAFRAGDISDLAHQVKELLGTPEQDRQGMGRQARQIVVNEFSWDTTVRRVRSLVKG